jgi:MEMO1 family protein
MPRFLVVIFVILLTMPEISNSQSNMNHLFDRQPAVAGQFYPADSKKLEKELESLFAKALPNKGSEVLAIISPHAGYVFSGEVAATAFNQIDINKDYHTIFLIGSSHRSYFYGAAIYVDGNFITPLGTVEVDTALGNKLISEYSFFTNNNEAHKAEHTLEVQLPFLQYKLRKPFRIVPIVIGTDDASVCKKIANALSPYFTSANLFVISTDFSHYPVYADAVKVDKLTADAIETNSPKNLMDVLRSNEKLPVSNLLTSLCGWSSVLSLLYITEKNKDLKISLIEYKNSGDSKPYGDTSRVVGYTAMTVSKTEGIVSEFSLSAKDKEMLLDISRKTLESYIRKGIVPTIDSAELSPSLKANCGAFVSLHKNGNLRGCIGRFNADKSLYLIVEDMTIAAATEDTRFSKVNTSELSQIDIEISVLSPMRKIQSINEIELGKHGIYIRKGNSGGTFLPQVATQTGWTKEEFLGHCSEDKAGLGWNGWKEADIYVYTAIIFGEKKVK